MDMREFKKLLRSEGIPFTKNGNGIIVGGEEVDLDMVLELPENVIFSNSRAVSFGSLKFISKGVEFYNGGSVFLNSIETLPEGFVFNNGGSVDVYKVKTIPKGVKFNNGENVNLSALKCLQKDTEFNNGGTIDLSSLMSFPRGFKFNSGSYVFFRGGYKVKKIRKPYIERFKIKRKRNKVYLYKRVSHNFKTQEGTENETLWKVGTTVDHPKWNPTRDECGEGKFHACARPHWCSYFRYEKKDKFIKLEVDIKDLYEWTDPAYPQKIAFRKGKVIEEVKLPFKLGVKK